jgi:hypothetical protein
MSALEMSKYVAALAALSGLLVAYL